MAMDSSSNIFLFFEIWVILFLKELNFQKGILCLTYVIINGEYLISLPDVLLKSIIRLLSKYLTLLVTYRNI